MDMNYNSRLRGTTIVGTHAPIKTNSIFIGTIAPDMQQVRF